MGATVTSRWREETRRGVHRLNFSGFESRAWWHGSLLFFSRPRSESWPHHGRTFSIIVFCHCDWLFHWESCPRIDVFTASPIHVVVLKCRKICPTGNRWNRVLFVSQNIFGVFSGCRYCADRARSLPWPAPNIWLTMFQISSKSVHFRRSYWPIEYLQYSSDSLRANNKQNFYCATQHYSVLLFDAIYQWRLMLFRFELDLCRQCVEAIFVYLINPFSSLFPIKRSYWLTVRCLRWF